MKLGSRRIIKILGGYILIGLLINTVPSFFTTFLETGQIQIPVFFSSVTTMIQGVLMWPAFVIYAIGYYFL